MKNILLLTDFSDTSKNAILYALHLFEKEVCNFYILFVEDSKTCATDELNTTSPISLSNSSKNENKKNLTEYVVGLESEFNNENSHFYAMVDNDSLVNATNKTIKAKKIDLLVMGTNGSTGAKEVVFGSNILHVIRKVKYTTLIVPQNFEYDVPKEMLLALDAFDKLNGKAIHEFFKFLKHHAIRLNVLRICPDDDTYDIGDDDKGKLTNHLKSGNYAYSLINDVPMEYAVDTYLQTKKIDILSLFVQNETFLERLFMGSSTAKINKLARVPLLIFHT